MMRERAAEIKSSLAERKNDSSIPDKTI